MIKSGCLLDCVYREAMTDHTNAFNNTCSRRNEQVAWRGVGGGGRSGVRRGTSLTGNDCSPEHSYVNKTLHLQHRSAVTVLHRTQ